MSRAFNGPRYCGTPLLKDIHLLDFKISYISLKQFNSGLGFRSNIHEKILKELKFKKASTLGDRKFAVTVPTLWNKWPEKLRKKAITKILRHICLGGRTRLNFEEWGMGVGCIWEEEGGGRWKIQPCKFFFRAGEQARSFSP